MSATSGGAAAVVTETVLGGVRGLMVEGGESVLLMVTGWRGRIESFRPLLEWLGAHGQAAAVVNLLDSSQRWTFEDAVKRLPAIIAELAPRPVVLMGHSYGCVVASSYWITHSERRVRALVLDAPPLVAPPRRLLAAARLDGALPAAGQRRLRSRVIDSWARQGSGPFTLEQVGEEAAHALRLSRLRERWFAPHLLTGQVLLVLHTHDALFPIDRVVKRRNLRAWLVDHRVEVVRARHTVRAEDEVARLAEALVRFVRPAIDATIERAQHAHPTPARERRARPLLPPRARGRHTIRKEPRMAHAMPSPRRNVPRGITFLVLAMGLFLASSDYSALNVGLPTLQRLLGAGEGSLALIVDAFGLTTAGLIIPGGSLGDRFGRRRIFALGLAVLAAGAACAAWAIQRRSIDELIGARLIMGAGAGLLMPTFLSTLRQIYTSPSARRTVATSYSAVIGIGVVTGPALGGWTIQRWGIRWIFLGTAVIALVVALLSRFVPETRDREPRPTDLLGAVLAMGGLGASLWALIEAPSQGWHSHRIAIALGVGVLALVTFLLRQRSAANPLIPRAFATKSQMWGAAAAIAIAYAIVGGTLFALAPQLQVVLGYDPFAAGLRQMPAAGGAMVGSLLALVIEQRLRRISVSATVAFGFVLLAAAEWRLWTVHVDSGYRPLLFVMGIGGIGWGLATARLSGVIMELLPSSQASAAAAFDEANRQTALIVGVAVVSTLIDVVYRNHLDGALGGLPRGAATAARDNVAQAAVLAQRLGRAGTALGAQARMAYTDAVDRVGLGFLAAAGVAIMATVLIGLISRRRSRRTSGVAPAWARDPVRTREWEAFGELMSTVPMSDLDDLLLHAGLSALVQIAEEAGGQRLLVPAMIDATERAVLEAAGMTFEPPLESDPLFRPAKQPADWNLSLAPNRRWLEIVDAHGLVRAVIRYEAGSDAEHRWAGIALAIGDEGQDIPPADVPALQADVVRRQEQRQLSGLEGVVFPLGSPELHAARTAVGLSQLEHARRTDEGLWTLVPSNPAALGLLSQQGAAIRGAVPGDAMFTWVLTPGDDGWERSLHASGSEVQLRDPTGRLRLSLIYRHGAQRWASAIPMTRIDDGEAVT